MSTESKREWAVTARRRWRELGICICCGARPVRPGVSRLGKPYASCNTCIARTAQWRRDNR